MLLALDVGNTHVVAGAYDGSRLVAHWRFQTNYERTADEYGALLLQLFAARGIVMKAVSAVAVSSVVPQLSHTLKQLSEQYFGCRAFFVGPGVKTGMRIRYDNPKEVGADRIVNAVAAFERWKSPLIVVDFGTATTFDVVSSDGEYLGGAIAPGIHLAADALFQRTSKLPKVEFEKPPSVIGTNTIASMQSGLFFGYVSLVDGICDRMVEQLATDPKVVATGGMAGLLAGASRRISIVDEFLTLDGLRIVFERNHTHGIT